MEGIYLVSQVNAISESGIWNSAYLDKIGQIDVPVQGGTNRYKTSRFDAHLGVRPIGYPWISHDIIGYHWICLDIIGYLLRFWISF